MAEAETQGAATCGMKEGQTTMTKKLTNQTFGRGGKNPDVPRQIAAVKTRGRTGPDTARHPDERFATAGGKVPGKLSKIGTSAPAVAGRTGNAAGSKPRDYGRKR
jgi:hypothetical protein